MEISRKTFVDAFEKDNDPLDFKTYVNLAFAKETMIQQLCNPDSCFYFLLVNDELAGYFKLNENQSQSEKMPDEALELERIYVLTNFQRMGLGSFILKEAIRIAMAKKKNQLWLGVWQENLDAVRFYEKHGFIKYDTHPYYIGNDKQTDWLMRIDLSNFS